MERVPHGSSTSLSNMTIQSLIYSLVVFIQLFAKRRWRWKHQLNNVLCIDKRLILTIKGGNCPMEKPTDSTTILQGIHWYLYWSNYCLW